MMIENNPWQDLAKPAAIDVINARRVDPLLPYHFFWARAMDGAYLLVLKHDHASKPKEKLPHLKGVEVALWQENQVESMLVLKLLDPEQRDIFYRLCKDVIESAAAASSEREVVRRTVARTWRWHHLLRGGQDACLSVEEQKGLIGELLVLERLLLPTIPAADAVQAWRGPLGAPKDFEINTVCLEAKARRGAATPYVSISSEHQLDITSVDALFLYVIDLSRAGSEHLEAVTLPEIARRVRLRVESLDAAALDQFDALIDAAGLREEDDYSAYRWIEGHDKLYVVEDGFPRLSTADVPLGISRVTYSLALSACEPFRVELQDLIDAMEAARYVQ